jgi:hypothetical protein
MNRTLATFERHIQAPSPAFLCSRCGDPDGTPTFIAEVEHRVGESASVADLELLRQTLGPGCGQAFEFYSQHDGITLYCDKRSHAAGIRFFPIGDWPRVTAEVRDDFRATGLDGMYGSLLEGTVIGEVCNSGNFFLYQTSWRRRGRIYYLMHDPMYEKPPGFRSLAGLLADIMADPAVFLNAMGCYTRFSDGETDMQWIPERFVQQRTVA